MNVDRRFHRSLYDAGAVARAAARFAPLAGSVTVVEEGSDVRVTLADVRESVRERVGDELANHALFESILARRAGA